jgi:hypothetical protein
MAFQVKVKVEITKDSQPFHTTDMSWDNCEYNDVAVIEAALIDGLKQLNNQAKEQKGKK